MKDSVSLKSAFPLMKQHFIHSNKRKKSWLLLTGAVLCIVGSVVLTVALAWWSAGFWAVLTAKATGPFLVSMGHFSVLVSALVSTHILKNYLLGKLSILWRNALTKKIVGDLFEGENNFLDLKRFSSKIDNIAQRIQEDVKNFVELTLNLGTELLRSTLSLIMFSSTLWSAGGSLSFVAFGVGIVIPGYMFWMALLTAVAATSLTHMIAKSLAKRNQKAEQSEADFRQDLAEIEHDAENIAEEHAENYYKSSIRHKVDTLNKRAHQKLNIQTRLVAFQNFYNQLSGVLPTLLSAPMYFLGLIDIGQLMEIGIAFGQVNLSLTWFVDSYEQLSQYKSSLQRVLELQNTFEPNALHAHPKTIVRKERAKDSFNIKGLNILPPQNSSTTHILKNLNLKFCPGEHVLIQGPSGIGKSTLFKAISGTWRYGDGKVSVPTGKRLCFLPQKPTLPNDSLRAVLAYPEPIETYTDEQYVQALKTIGGMDHFASRLDEKQQWSHMLSGGQQQKISFARALLKKPDWLFLDEATAALDSESEKRAYESIRALGNTTIVSIAHRDTVIQYHDRVVELGMNF